MTKTRKLLPLLHGSPFAIPLAALAALALLLISESSFQQASSRVEALAYQGEARAVIQTLRRSLTDAETGQRGYLLTDRNEYLKPYQQAHQQVDQSLEWLHHYYADDPGSREPLHQLDVAVHGKLSELAETMRLHDRGDESAWRNILLSNIGEEQMDTVRRLSEALMIAQTERIDASRRSVMRTLQFNRWGVSLMTVFSLAALYMYLRQTTALVRLREEQRRIVQAERDALGLDVMRRTEQLTELARHLQTVREDERNHLARELHDELGALLTAAKLDLSRLKSRLGSTTPEIAERLQHLSDGLNSGIALKRRIVEDLRPSSLSNLGLVAALEILVREWSQGTEIAVDSALEPVRLRPSGELTVYRLVQEALTNVSKYARASHVEVTLSAQGGRVAVSVRDNGVGFNVEQPRTRTHGLLGMRYRLESEGGRLLLRSTPGRGTWIEAELPEAPPQPPEAAQPPPGSVAAPPGAPADLPSEDHSTQNRPFERHPAGYGLPEEPVP